jgi:hypothetical protein
MELEYVKCVEYLRDNKGINIQQLSDETEVSIKQITRWVKEGRISLLNAPNMSYPCESCGTLIREGHICDSCRNRLSREVKNATEGPTKYALPNDKTGAYQIGKRLKDK